jgi:hypothetical protein
VPLKGEFKSHCLRGHPLSGDNIKIRSHLARGVRWEYRACRECARASSATARANNPEKYRTYAREFARNNPRGKALRRQRRYGLSAEGFAALLENQGGVCAICGAPNAASKELCVDHDHLTGRIRGLLCNACNVAVGLFRDDPRLLERARGYLGGVC